MWTQVCVRCCHLGPQGVENKRCYELNEEEINKIREEVGKYTTEADLVRGRNV
jgi:ribosomal protein S13